LYADCTSKKGYFLLSSFLFHKNIVSIIRNKVSSTLSIWVQTFFLIGTLWSLLEQHVAQRGYKGAESSYGQKSEIDSSDTAGTSGPASSLRGRQPTENRQIGRAHV
jgi:hypothetical protein